MADEVRDALMMFQTSPAFQGESLATISSGDELAEGFKPATKDNNWISNFVQLRSFKMDMGLLGDTAGDPEAEKRQQEELQKLYRESVKEGEDALRLAATKSGSDYASFMRAPGKVKAYSSNLESIVINKNFDIASLALFTACTACTTIKSASIIKRRGGGGEQLYTYLRIDLQNILITDLNWDEDEVISEKITLICRSATVRYRVEQASGKLDVTLPEQKWSAELNLK